MDAVIFQTSNKTSLIFNLLPSRFYSSDEAASQDSQIREREFAAIYSISSFRTDLLLLACEFT